MRVTNHTASNATPSVAERLATKKSGFKKGKVVVERPSWDGSRRVGVNTRWN